MQLYIMRHGEAELARSGLTDPERQLTPQGLAEAAQMGRWLARQDRVPVHIISSPFCRAEQTARQVLAQLPQGTSFDFSSCLTYHSRPKEVLPLLAESYRGGVLLVSHMPLVSSLTEFLIGAPAPDFATAALVGLEMPVALAGCSRFLGYRAPFEVVDEY